MERNTIILSVDAYNKLRDFKINIEKGNTYPVLQEMETTDEAVQELLKINKQTMRGIFEPRIYSLKGKTVFEVKKMSIWKFIKWRNL